MIKIISVAALVITSATASFAGSLNTQFESEVEAAPVIVPFAGSGIGAPAIIGGVLAAAAVAALVSNSNDDEATVTTTIAE